MRRLLGIAALLLLGGLVLTNPGMDAFSSFVEDRSARILQQETGDSPVGRAIAGAGAGLAASFVDRVTQRQNYFAFSIYTIDLDDTPNDADYDWRFLGIGRQFIELDAPDDE